MLLESDSLPPEKGFITPTGVITPTLRTTAPEDAGEPQGSHRAPVFVRQHQAGAGFESRLGHNNDDNDDRESVAALAPPDNAYSQLMKFVYDRFPHSLSA